MKKAVWIVLAFFLIPSLSFSHSGRTDAQGGHYNRKTGEYHYHGKKVSSPPVSSETRTVPKTAIYHGNVKSKKFHTPSCRYYNCSNCTAVFETKEGAIQAGYIPCKVCRP